MVAQSTASLLKQASGWSILWGVLLIMFGVVAIGSPLLAAVAVNALIAPTSPSADISCCIHFWEWPR